MASESKENPQGGGTQGQGKSDNGNSYRKIHSDDPGRTPGSAEGEEDTVDKALDNEGGKQSK